MSAWIPASPWILVLLLVSYRYARRRPHLRDYQPQITGPPISVVIPARNQAVNIETCVRSVLRTQYESLGGATDFIAEGRGGDAS